VRNFVGEKEERAAQGRHSDLNAGKERQRRRLRGGGKGRSRQQKKPPAFLCGRGGAAASQHQGKNEFLSVNFGVLGHEERHRQRIRRTSAAGGRGRNSSLADQE